MDARLPEKYAADGVPTPRDFVAETCERLTPGQIAP